MIGLKQTELRMYPITHKILFIELCRLICYLNHDRLPGKSCVPTCASFYGYMALAYVDLGNVEIITKSN